MSIEVPEKSRLASRGRATIKAVRGAARLKNSCREKRRRTKRLTKVDNEIEYLGRNIDFVHI